MRLYTYIPAKIWKSGVPFLKEKKIPLQNIIDLKNVVLGIGLWKYQFQLSD